MARRFAVRLSQSGARCCVREAALRAALEQGEIGELAIVRSGGTRIAAAVRLVRTATDDTVDVTFLHLSALDRRYLEGDDI